MIKESRVEIVLNAKTIKHYWLLNYIGTPGDKIMVFVKDLTTGSHVKITAICACKNENIISYKTYLKSLKNQRFYCCHKCCLAKKQLTCIKKYGVSNQLKNKNIQNKIKKTNFLRYGKEHIFLTDNFLNNEEIKNKRKHTRISKNQDIPDHLLSQWNKYLKTVRNLTRKTQILIFTNWNGIDFYDEEDIKENFKYHHTNNLYPTIDHKISVKYGFDNNISPETICKIDNLCITKRKHNSSKRHRNYKEYFNLLKNL